MRLFFLSAEPSADLYASLIIKAICELPPLPQGEVEIFGVGGEELELPGAKRIMDNRKLSVIGFWEGAKSSLRLYRIKEKLKKEISAIRPQVFLPISFGSFSLPLCCELKKRGIRIVYISPPQIWAWGRKRAEFLRRYVDKVICLFPFERDFYQRCGINSLYFGNPLVKFVKPRLKREEIFSKYGLPEGAKVICLTPGSRPGEIKRHLPFLLKLFSLISEKRAFVGFVLLPRFLLPHFPTLPSKIQIASEDKYDLISISELVIGKLGTIALEVALLGKAYIGIYLPHPLSYFGGRFLVKTPFFSLPNLILQEKVFPEFIRPDIREVRDKVLEVLDFPRTYEKATLALRRRFPEENPAARIAEEIFKTYEQKKL